MNVPFYRPSITDSEIAEVVDCLRSGWLTTGPKTRLFEQEFGHYLQQKHAVGVNSCTAALHLGLEAAGVKSGDVVVVPTMTFAATAEVVRYLDAKPLLVDCSARDFNIDIADAEEKILAARERGERPVAIIPVHYGGQVADMAGIIALARRFGLKVIEDAAHCCPAYYRYSENEPWKPVGAEADVACFSFYANKTITTGEGGMACTNNEQYADRMRVMCLHGISKDAWKRFTAEGDWYYEIIAPGYKYNMSDVLASIGIHQLRRSDDLHRQRAELAARYTAALAPVEELILPKTQPNRIHSWHLYVIRLRLDKLGLDRNHFVRLLKERGIVSSVHWMPLHMHPYYRATYGYQPEHLPVAASLFSEIVTLPMFPGMTDDQLFHVTDSIKTIIADHRR